MENPGDFAYAYFRSLLTKIDSELSREDVQRLTFLCDEFLTGTNQQSIVTGHQLFDLLERKGLIDPDNVILLNFLFRIIGRIDLLEMLPGYNTSLANDSDTEMMPSLYEYVSPFSCLLFQINEELPPEEVEKLRYAYGKVPRNVQISTGLDLFRVMKKQRAISPENLETLRDLLEIIDRNDLVSLMEDISSQSAAANLWRSSHGAGDSEFKQNQASPTSVQSFQPSNNSQPQPISYVQKEDEPEPIDKRQEEFAARGRFVASSNVNGMAQECHDKSLPPMRSISVPSGTPHTEESLPSRFQRLNVSNEENHTVSVCQAAQFQEEPMQTDIPDDKYKMTSEPRGVCLVINNVAFEAHPNAENLLPRRGSDIDAENLKRCFELLKFDVHIKRNLTLAETRHCLENYSRMNHASHDCFVCCFLSHGTEGSVYCSDSLKMEVKELITYFSPKYCSSLGGKPKLFFLSCCQGKTKPEAVPHPEAIQLERDGIPEEDTNQVSSEAADFLIGYATMFGYASFRDVNKGTIYIQTLTEILTKYHKKRHLVDMLVMVNADINRKTLTLDGKDYKQIGAPQVILTKQVWF